MTSMYENQRHPRNLILIIIIKMVKMMIIREWVVTAAHCMRGENWRKLKVVLGELDRRDQYETENRSEDDVMVI